VVDHGPTILVFDEDILALELYSRELSKNYRVLCCQTVQDARKSIHSQTINLIVLEPASNEDEGWGLLREIQLLVNPPLVVICSTQDERKAGLNDGAFAYLVKPVLPLTLHHLVDTILDPTSINKGK
jgi:DNA-binding response OmpR family regulator